ncbi:hypothetical protein, partial [Hafnia paralvei]|uniref:hypothetical protein n=1 Tax=Hafnia paralvei TaxID=546367 RepID=UPI0038D19255
MLRSVGRLDEIFRGASVVPWPHTGGCRGHDRAIQLDRGPLIYLAARKHPQKQGDQNRPVSSTSLSLHDSARSLRQDAMLTTMFFDLRLSCRKRLFDRGNTQMK